MINKQWFLDKIHKFLIDNESNKMIIDDSLIFNPDCIVGFVSGNDSIFIDYKNIIGSFHLTPLEVFEWYAKRNEFKYNKNSITVVSFILPINNKTKIENHEYSKKWPSEKWARTRLFGEKANCALQRYLVDELKNKGIHAIAPTLESKLFKIYRKHENGVWASNWSHRHMAFAAGLGSFGLSDGFINEKGKAMRTGSIIMEYEIENTSTNRPSDPYQYCTECGDCIERCPVEAISFENRHNKQICSKHVMSSIPYIKNKYNINIYACGLCQVNVSCSNGIPLNK